MSVAGRQGYIIIRDGAELTSVPDNSVAVGNDIVEVCAFTDNAVVHDNGIRHDSACSDLNAGGQDGIDNGSLNVTCRADETGCYLGIFSKSRGRGVANIAEFQVCHDIPATHGVQGSALGKFTLEVKII